jgi:hypothetical protein
LLLRTAARRARSLMRLTMAKLDPALLRWPSATDGPTFSRNDDFAAMRDALIVSRCFLVRGAIDGGAVNALRKSAEAAYSRWDRIAELPPADADRFLYGHIPIGELGCDRELETMVNVGYVRDLMRNVFGWDLPLKCPESYLLRRLMPPRLRSARVVPRVAFHQDEAFAISSDPGLTEQPQLCFTMWLPLRLVFPWCQGPTFRSSRRSLPEDGDTTFVRPMEHNLYGHRR